MLTGISLGGHFFNENVWHVIYSAVHSSLHEVYICVNQFSESVCTADLAVLNKWAPVQ